MTNTIEKVYHNGTEYSFKDPSLNTKTFYLSSTSDLTNAQAAYDRYKSGKNAIVITADFPKIPCFFSSGNSTKLIFKSSVRAIQMSSYSYLSPIEIQFSLSGDTVTAITNQQGTIAGVLATDVDYSTPYTPTYNGSPATKKYVDDKQSTIYVTLAAANWSSKSITVTATGVTSSNTVIVSPDPSSMDDYTNGKVYCSAQGTDSLTFSCDTEPTNDITVNVVILN